MALLRGDILALYIKTASASVLTTGSENLETSAHFYNDAIWKLQLLMALLAVAMELGSGMAIFEARKIDLTALKQAALARKELQDLEVEMVGIIGRIVYLENEPAVREAEFYRNFYLGLLERLKRNALIQLGLIFALSTLLFPTSGLAQAERDGQPIDTSVAVVIALDLSQSVAATGYDGKTEYARNIEAACELISHLPPGSQLTVLAITDQSFSLPYVLLSRQLPRDKGPLQFHDRIATAKAQIAAELRRISQSSPPKFQQTDILGALVVAADILRDSKADRRLLVIFSDMRQTTKELDLERPNVIAIGKALQEVGSLRLIADLRDAEVYVLGVHGAGKSVAYWNDLREFWRGYFQKA
ncbi:MAG: VWA domain-containing protein, partial [Acidobacteria bacterium]|nr:VWA domain-containing protein [Acidobacteriota bacterium]